MSRAQTTAVRWRAAPARASTTDNGNLIPDVVGLSITDPVGMESAINQIAGVVTVGLFARAGFRRLAHWATGGVKTV